MSVALLIEKTCLKFIEQLCLRCTASLIFIGSGPKIIIAQLRFATFHASSKRSFINRVDTGNTMLTFPSSKRCLQKACAEGVLGQEANN